MWGRRNVLSAGVLGFALIAVVPLAPAASTAAMGGNPYRLIEHPEALAEPTTVVVAPDGTVHAAAPAQQDDGPVYPDPAFIEQVPGAPCTPQGGFEQHVYPDLETRYGDDCKRIHFAWGPITVKPGQNDVMIEPATIQKPAYDGYIVRFKPDLLRALDGGHPRTENMHLHHATWLNLGESYGDGPFFAAGEEKTISTFPTEYGMKVLADDAWGLLYMVHNATTQPEEVWITYQIDYVEASVAESEHGIVPVKPFWLDVQKEPIHTDAPETSAYPVFNVQRGFGHVDPETGTMVCRWPDENCARYDAYGDATPQQGVDVSDQVDGQDYAVPADMAGTIIGLGGHLHPGGIRDEVSLIRDGVEKTIFLSDALYWDYQDSARIGAPPTSWNMSMTVTGAPLGWKVKIREGDVIRINAVYDSELASWYENMGIVIAYVAPEDPHGVEGVDVFAENVVLDRGVSTAALTPEGPYHHAGFRPEPCTPDLVGVDGTKRLCLRGMVTHGQLEESQNTFPGCDAGGCPPLPETEGPLVTDIYAGAFTYGNADMGVVATTGIPRVKKGEPLRLWNLDGGVRLWHTFTRCKEPCTGPTTVNYPIADGGGGPGDVMDFDSGEIGYGMPWEPTTSKIGGDEQYDEKWVRDAVYWEFTPTETGVYTFYCRIHPGMRGVFEVVE